MTILKHVHRHGVGKEHILLVWGLVMLYVVLTLFGLLSIIFVSVQYLWLIFVATVPLYIAFSVSLFSDPWRRSLLLTDQHLVITKYHGPFTKAPKKIAVHFFKSAAINESKVQIRWDDLDAIEYGNVPLLEKSLTGDGLTTAIDFIVFKTKSREWYILPITNFDRQYYLLRDHVRHYCPHVTETFALCD